MEDTESGVAHWADSARAPVTVGSIRWRILKVELAGAVDDEVAGYSGLDPMEDTERSPWPRILPLCEGVTVGSIRWRILKATRKAPAEHPTTRYSGLDPMEDTERAAGNADHITRTGLQC